MNTFKIYEIFNTSASKYGKSSCSLIPTTGNLLPVSLASLATLYALSPYVLAKC